ncbi:unnamed protein product [Eruca vesicaria subsp. sativa]|uniref:Uncharacterized protein n=1 Tax=Eruca vesicaria subsp. sativa TaxID=29727 RepID=A0ABC8JMN6_ERUVS|nr:unnamed protein product [Eruca vesicaria subsp. sativa]
MFLMVTVSLPLRFRPPPDPPPCKFLPLGSLSPIEPPEPPDPPDATSPFRFLITFSSLSLQAVAQTLDLDFPLLAYPSLWDYFHPTMIVESIIYSAIECPLHVTVFYSVIECSLPVTTFYSAIECSLPIISWFQIFLTLSRMEYLMLNYRFSPWLWFQILIVTTLLEPISTSLLPWFLYPCCSCVARLTFGLEDCSTDDLFSVLFKGPASWCLITSAIVANVKIVVSALVAVPITSIRSLIVFFVSHGVIPLLKPSVVEIRGRLSNVSCLCIMIASIFLFLLAFCCSKVVSRYGFVIIFVNIVSSNGD